jgi:hypothetical protein
MQWGHVISAPTIKCSNLLGRAKNKKKGGQLTCEGCGTLHITVRDGSQAHLVAHHPPAAQAERSGRCAHQADQRQVRADEVARCLRAATPVAGAPVADTVVAAPHCYTALANCLHADTAPA